MSSRRTATGTIRYMSSVVLQILGGGVLTVFLPRALAPEQYATYAVASSVASWIEMIGCFALGAGLARLVAGAGDDWKPVVRAALLAALLGMSALAILAFGAAPLIARGLGDPELTGFLRLFVLDFPAFVVFMLLLNVLTGRGLHTRRALAWSTYWIAKPTFAVILVGSGLSVKGAVLASIGASFIGMIVAVRLTRPGLPARSASLRPLWSYAWPLVLGGVALHLSRNVDLWLVQALCTDKRAAAYYGIACVSYGTGLMLLISVVMAALPTLTSALKEKRTEDARELVREALRFVWLLGLAMASVFLVTGDSLVMLVFSNPYRATADPLSILLFGLLFLASASVFQTVLVASGRPHRILPGNLAGLLLGLMLDILLIPRYGIVGAAVGTSAGFVLSALLLGAACRRNLTHHLPALTAMRCGVAAAAVILIGGLAETSGLMSLLLAILLTGIYFGVLVLLRELGRSDFEALAGALRFRKRTR
jgi:O-antigen/teichoic acid export membrane protein